MGEIVTLRDGKDQREWKCAFVSALVGLCPDVNPDSADEASDAEYCEGLDPVLAATHWAARLGPPPAAHVGLHRERHVSEADAA
jgi:hypothetical protein